MKYFFLLLSVLLIGDARAQWKSDTLTGGKMIVRRSPFDYSTSSFSDGQGGTMHFFSQLVDRINGGNKTTVKMQHCDSAGLLRMGTVDSGITVMPEITNLLHTVSDSAGGVYLLYSLVSYEAQLSPDSFYLFLQHVNGNGQTLWGQYGKLLSVQNLDFDFSGKLVVHGGGAVSVVYKVMAYGATYGQLFAQKFTAGGTVQWGVNGINVCTAAEKRAEYYITHDGAGGVWAVFEDGRNSVPDQNGYYSNMDIYTQHINTNGTLALGSGGSMVTNAANNQLLYPDKFNARFIFPDAAGGCYFLYETEVTGSWEIKDIYVQRLSAAGTTQWAGMGTLIVRSDYNNSLVFDAKAVLTTTGGIAVLHTESDNGGSISRKVNIYQQTINSAGVPVYTAGRGKKIATGFNSEFNDASVESTFDFAYNAGGEMLLLFRDSDSAKSLRLQKFAANGQLTWDSAGKTIIKQRPFRLQLINAGNNTIAQWLDDRNYSEFLLTTFDLFQSRFDNNGVVSTSRNIITTANNGNWNNPATWVGGIVPGADDKVVITKTITVNASATCYSLSVQPPSGAVTVATGVSLVVLH